MEPSVAGMVKRRAVITLLSLLILTPIGAATPQLTVLLVVEQFRADYLERYGSELGPGGLRRLIGGGAYFPRARFETAASWTAPAAATVATGAWANGHGIVADAWFDRKEGRVVRATENSRGPAPTRLIGSTLADELYAATDARSRIVAVGGDPDAVVLLAGRRPRGCYWQGESGAWQSSSYYGATTPEWVARFQNDNPLSPTNRRAWTALAAKDDAPPLRVLDTEGFLDLYKSSPFAVSDVFAFAVEAVKAEKLGQRNFPDMLIVSVSAPARLALETGADSPLMRDMILRLDDSIGLFLDEVDKLVGLDSTQIVFTGLHGSPPHRDEARRLGFVAGAVPGERVATAVDQELQAAFGPQVGVHSYVYPFLKLSGAVAARPPEERRRILETAGRAALTEPGVAAWYAPEADSGLGRGRELFENAWHPSRSGDMILAYEPYFSEEFGDGRGVTTGSRYRYDTETPLILFGSRFQPGRYERTAPANAIAPTLAAALGLATPSVATGEVLVEVMPDRPPGLIGPPSQLR